MKKQDQGLAIAYEMKRRNRKKMADGGPVSASSEKRPMPEQRSNDTHMVSQNDTKKSLPASSWTDNPSVEQAQRPRTQKISRPKFVNGAFKVRDRDDVEKEEMLMSAAAPNNGPQHQPDEEYNEERPMRQGPKVPDMHREHNNDRKPYFEGGSVSMKDSENDEVQHPAGLEEDDDQMRPSEDEYMSQRFARGGEVDEDMDSRPDGGYGAIIVKGGGSKPSRPQEYADGGDVDTIDMSGSTGKGLDPKKVKSFIKGGGFAEGGSVDEQDMEHHASVAAAIMAKKDRASRLDSDSDDDAEIMMADGGEVDLDMNAMEEPNQYYDRNENAALKENYDDQLSDLDYEDRSIGDRAEDDEENKHDMVTSIRSKMIKRRVQGLP